MQQFSTFFVTNWLLFLALAIILFMLVRSYVSAAKSLGPVEALQLINHQNALVLDVRTDKEYQEGHIINSMPIPLGLLPNQLTKLAGYKQTPIVIVCRSGARSAQAAGILRKAGFEEVYNLAGGIMAWQNANMPLTTEKGKPPKPGAARAEEKVAKKAGKKKARKETEAKESVSDDADEKQAVKAIGQDMPADEATEAAPGKEAGSSDVVIYTAAHCPFCVRAVQLLKDKGVAYTEVSVDGKPELRQEMTQKAGSSSVPQVFVGGRHIGDCDGIHALDAQGKLDELLGLA